MIHHGDIASLILCDLVIIFKFIVLLFPQSVILSLIATVCDINGMHWTLSNAGYNVLYMFSMISLKMQEFILISQNLVRIYQKKQKENIYPKCAEGYFIIIRIKIIIEQNQTKTKQKQYLQKKKKIKNGS